MVIYTMKQTYLFECHMRPSWQWSYGSWIYNYLWNQCLSPLIMRCWGFES